LKIDGVIKNLSNFFVLIIRISKVVSEQKLKIGHYDYFGQIASEI